MPDKASHRLTPSTMNSATAMGGTSETTGADRRFEWQYGPRGWDWAPRHTAGGETPLTEESGRVRDDSHALAPGLAGRIPGPLNLSSRQDV